MFFEFLEKGTLCLVDFGVRLRYHHVLTLAVTFGGNIHMDVSVRANEKKDFCWISEGRNSQSGVKISLAKSFTTAS